MTKLFFCPQVKVNDGGDHLKIKISQQRISVSDVLSLRVRLVRVAAGGVVPAERVVSCRLSGWCRAG